MAVPPPAYDQQSHDQAQYPQNPQIQPQHTFPEAIVHQQAPAQVYSPPHHDQKSAFPPPQAHTPAPTMAQPGYAPQAAMGQPHPIPLASLMKDPAWISCPACSQVQMTRCEFVSGTTTHLWALALCCCLCLGCIPYCMSSLKNVEHHCGHCGTLLATYKRGSGTEVNAAAMSGMGAMAPPPQKQ